MFVAALRGFHRELLLFIRAPAVFTGGDVVVEVVVEGTTPLLTVNISLEKVNGEITACMNDVIKV